MIIYPVSCLVVACLIVVAVYSYLIISSIYESQAEAIKLLNEKNTKLLSQKKSSETRLGQIGEHFAPLLDVFPYDAKDARFLGSPIDFVVFDFEGDQIVLVEFKTGESKESKRQKQVREMVEKGNVKYELIRVRGKDGT